MDKSKLIANLISIGKSVAPLVPLGVAGVAAAQAVLAAFHDAKEAVGATPEKVAEFESTREALEAAVNAHATRTAASLGD